VTSPPAPLPGAPEPLLPGSVVSYLVTDLPLCSPDTTAAGLQSQLMGSRYESAVDVAVGAGDGVHAHRLLGLIPLEVVLAVDGATPARDLMDPDPPAVAPGVNQEEAA
jgi:magnesium transporter